MKASVIIITRNQRSLLEKSLPRLLKQDLGGGYEIIVVDSGSTDGAVKYVESLPVKLVRIFPKTFNYARAFNTGAGKAKGEYLVRLSGDAVPLRGDFLTELVKPFDDPKVGGTYGRYTISGRKGYSYPNYWGGWRFPEKLKRYSVKPVFGMGLIGRGGMHLYDFAGAACAVRREIWRKRGLNEGLVAGEDAEYGWFLHLIGYDIVCNPRAVVLHEHPVKVSKAVRTYLGLNKWQVIFTWNILRYWLKRMAGIDPYRAVKYNTSD